MKLYDELVARGLIAQVTNEDEIREMVDNGKATFYIGFDPTADSLHVGHFMALCLMKRLQMAGNKPIALIGGGTAMIGDPSGRTDMRSMMTKETIQHNCDCFKKQMERFIEFGEGKAQMVNNADWLLDLNYVDVLREVGACFSVNNMLRAECYKQRMEKGLSFLEFNYMIMQSYDFYYLYQNYGCNMQFGGNDQWSNMLGGTELIRRKLGKDAHAMTITLLLNSEGKKMGKTASGAVWLAYTTKEDSIYEQYCTAHPKEAIDKLIKIVKRDYPEYVETMNETLFGKKIYYCLNFIMEKELFEEYFNWIYDILIKLEQEDDLEAYYKKNPDYNYIKIPAYLAERFINVWINHKIKTCNIKILEANTELLTDFGSKKINFLIGNIIIADKIRISLFNLIRFNFRKNK